MLQDLYRDYRCQGTFDVQTETLSGSLGLVVDTLNQAGITFLVRGDAEAGGLIVSASTRLLLNGLSMYSLRYIDTFSIGYDFFEAGSALKSYRYSDTLTSLQDSLWLTGGNVNLVSTVFDGDYEGDSNLVEHSAYDYFFMRIIDSTDTLLGYIQVDFPHDSGADYAYPLSQTPVIKSFAIQGQERTDTILGIANITRETKPQIYPNPFSDHLDISNEEMYHYSLFDLSGKLLLTGKGSKINSSQLATGAYLLLLQNGETSFYQKVIKAAF